MNKDKCQFVMPWSVILAEKPCLRSPSLVRIYTNGMQLLGAIYKKRRLMVVFLYNQTFADDYIQCRHPLKP